MATAETRPPLSVDELVLIGHECDECGGSGELPDRECPFCFGTGLIEHAISQSEFRELVDHLD